MGKAKVIKSPYAIPGHTVDLIIEVGHDDIVLVYRKNPPHGWALPGGFVEYGEGLWETAKREAEEETSLDIRLKEQFYTYSDPERNNLRHVLTTVFIAEAEGIPVAGDDAERAEVFSLDKVPELCFDHNEIMQDYLVWRVAGRRPGPARKTPSIPNLLNFKEES